MCVSVCSCVCVYICVHECVCELGWEAYGILESYLLQIPRTLINNSLRVLPKFIQSVTVQTEAQALKHCLDIFLSKQENLLVSPTLCIMHRPPDMSALRIKHKFRESSVPVGKLFKVLWAVKYVCKQRSRILLSDFKFCIVLYGFNLQFYSPCITQPEVCKCESWQAQ